MHANKRQANALALLSQTASVSYGRAMQADELAAALLGGELPTAITPHVATLLDEAPLSLILASVDELAERSGRPHRILWNHLTKWAHELQSPRAEWA